MNYILTLMKSELLDIYDSEGNPTGEYDQRSQVHVKGLWHPTVHLWLLNNRNELLFQKRAMDTEFHPGLWDLSAAGHVVHGDTLEQAALREANEEIGLTLLERDLIFIKRFRIEMILNDAYERVFQFTYLTRKNFEIEQSALQEEEVTALKWEPYSILKEIIANKDSSYVARYEEYETVYDFIQELLNKA